VEELTSWLQNFNKSVHLPEGFKWEFTLEDIVAAIDKTHPSAPGPDGIPFEAYKFCKSTAADILLRVANELMDPASGPPPAWFNKAVLVLLPKKVTPGYEQYGKVYEPKNMRPLSIVGFFQ
jgi:hypothetical protein